MYYFEISTHLETKTIINPIYNSKRKKKMCLLNF